jgi:hypothetical protein
VRLDNALLLFDIVMETYNAVFCDGRWSLSLYGLVYVRLFLCPILRCKLTMSYSAMEVGCYLCKALYM